MTPLPTVAMIQRAVAGRYRVRFATMREPRPIGKTRANNRRVSRARQVAMCLSARLTDHSLNRIGDFFGGRDHSTVIYACREIERRSRRDIRLRRRLRRITLQLIRK